MPNDVDDLRHERAVLAAGLGVRDHILISMAAVSSMANTFTLMPMASASALDLSQINTFAGRYKACLGATVARQDVLMAELLEQLRRRPGQIGAHTGAEALGHRPSGHA